MWEERLQRELPSAKDIPSTLLLDHLPEWILRLSQALRASNPRIETERLVRSSWEHGKQRADIGFSLNELLQEFEILRQVLFQLLEEGDPLRRRERDILLDALQLSTRNAVASFEKSLETRHEEALFTLPDLSWWSRLGITLGILGIVTVIQWYAWPVLKPLHYFFYYPALLLIALYGMPILGIFLSVLLGEFLFAKIPLALLFQEWGEGMRMAAFAANASFICLIASLLRRATLQAKSAHQELIHLYQDAETNFASLDALLESAPFGIVLLDSHSRYLRINQPLAEWNGLPISEHIGKPIFEVGELAKMKGPILRRVAETGETLRGVEISGTPANDPGKVHTFLCTFFPVRNNAGALTGIGGIILDITERKAIERELRREQERCGLALRAGEIGVWEMFPGSSEIIWSDRQFEIFDIAPTTATIKMDTILSRVHPEDVPRLKEEYERSKREKRDFLQEFRVVAKSGEIRWVQGNGRVFYDEKGRPSRMVGTNIDITGRKRFEEQLQAAVAQLTQERVLREQFVSALTHDLRTPLTAVRLTAQMSLRDPGDSDRVRTRAVRIIEGIDRADKMIRDLLDANRIRAGQRLPLNLSEFDISQWAAGAIEDLGSLYGDRFRFRPTGEIRGRWDRDALRRVLENLGSNAVKYGDPHAPIDVWIGEKGGWVEISVHNEGAPIPPEEQKKLFDYLHQGTALHPDGRRGWGIGLTLVKGVAEAHGGGVRVVSDSIRGTNFCVRIPRWAEEQALPPKTA